MVPTGLVDRTFYNRPIGRAFTAVKSDIDEFASTSISLGWNIKIRCWNCGSHNIYQEQDNGEYYYKCLSCGRTQ